MNFFKGPSWEAQKKPSLVKNKQSLATPAGRYVNQAPLRMRGCCWYPDRGYEDGVQTGGRGREEPDDLVVEESQPGGPSPEGVCRQVQFPADDTCLHLGDSVAAIAGSTQDRRQVRQEENRYAGGAAQLLAQ